MNCSTLSTPLVVRMVLALLLLSCVSWSFAGGGSSFPLGTWFYLTDWNGSKPEHLVTMLISEPTGWTKEELTRHGYSLEGYGSAPCNEWTAGVNIQGFTISFSEIGGTTEYCETPNEQKDRSEAALFSAMRRIRNWRLETVSARQQSSADSNGALLVLYGSGEKMFFTRCAVPSERNSCRLR